MTEVSVDPYQRLRGALLRFTAEDDEPCRYDHRDRCVVHGIQPLDDGPCPMAVARATLADVPAETPGRTFRQAAAEAVAWGVVTLVLLLIITTGGEFVAEVLYR